MRPQSRNTPRAPSSLPPDAPTLQAVCSNATVALFVMDARQHCVYMNPAAEQLTGFRLHEVQGRPLHDFVHHSHPDGRPYPLSECPIDRAFPENNQEQGEEVFVHKDGHFYPVAFTASPIRDARGATGTVLEVRPLTEQREAEAERQAMRDIGTLIVGELDLEKIVQAVTDTATRLCRAQFGAFFYNVTTPEGESLQLYTLSGAPRHRFDRFPLPRATALFGPTFQGHPTIRVADVTADPRFGRNPPYRGMPVGHLPVRSYMAVPVQSDTGEIIGGLLFGHAEPGVFQERDEQHVEWLAAQAAVAMTKARLFEEARAAREKAEDAARENERLYREAQEANRLKDEFLATVSHELRTPLSAILGWTRLLAGGQLDEVATRKAVATVDRNARHQAQIIEDLLDISRIVSGKLRLDVQLLMPATVVEAAIDSVRPAALAREIAIVPVIDPQAGPVSGDPGRLQQVVWNLLSNAVKFTGKGGQVHVTVARVHSHIEIAVRDTGRGIEPDFLPRLFDRFSQHDATTTRRHGGLGLGLAIVRQLVELHGGSVEAHSPGRGQGATFIVSLPAAPVGESRWPRGDHAHPGALSSALPPKLPETDLRGVRILLVDDDEDTRQVLSYVLEGRGAAVACCGSGEEALARWQEFEPTVIVSDIGMPGMDGHELMRRLRALERGSGRGRTPAVALTAYARVEDRMRALAEGFQMHVAKPVEPAELLAVVSTLRDWG